MKINESEIHAKYRRITEYLIAADRSITTMESCTSGLIASFLTDTEGASAILKGAFVTYSNEAKVMCGVPEDIISRFGVYSAETAEAMADAAMNAYRSDYSVGITGSFGNPDPANKDSVPGIIYIAVKDGNDTVSRCIPLPELQSRFEYKLAAADAAADLLLSRINILNDQ